MEAELSLEIKGSWWHQTKTVIIPPSDDFVDICIVCRNIAEKTRGSS